jgi:hypothetical protein
MGRQRASSDAEVVSREHWHQCRRGGGDGVLPVCRIKASFFGTLHGQGRDAVEFFTDKKIYIERWF